MLMCNWLRVKKMPQGNWHILHISHLLISILAHYHIITLIYGNYRYHHIGSFWLGRNHWLHERFCEAIGLSAGADCRSAGSKGFVCLVGSEAVPHIDRLYDSGASTGICPHLAGCSLALLPGGFSADPGNGAVSLGWLNHWLGAGLGALKYLLLTSLLIGVIEFIDGDNTLIGKTKKKESVLYYPMEEFAGIFFPAAKAVTEQIVNGDFD